LPRPNFLLIVTDQQRADHLGCYGNPIVRTPNIDGIAARGWRSEAFYVASAICMPNRATLMTGRMPSVHGVRHNGINLDLDATTFPEVLRAHGYRTALIGKSHLQNSTDVPPVVAPPDERAGPQSPPYALREARHRRRDAPYDQELRRRWLDDPAHGLRYPYYGFDDVKLCLGHGDAVEGDYGRWLRERLPGADGMRGPAGSAPAPEFNAPQAWRTRIPEELYPTSYVGQTTSEWLSAHAAGNPGQPFFVQCSFPDPHHPFTPPGRYWTMYDPADIPLPASFRPADRHSPPHLIHLQNERDFGTRVANTQAVFACDEREARESTALTYGMVAMIDDAVGGVLATLERAGLAENTVIVFISDHGDFMGDHQLMLKGPLHYRGVTRTPFIWYDPAARRDGASNAELAGTVDIASTVLDRAGLEPFNGIQGQSLLPLIAGGAGPRTALVIEEEGQRVSMGFPARVRLRTLLTDRYRLGIYDGVPWGELYDLDADPDEMVNRWSDPAYSSIRGDLACELSAALIALSETSPLPTQLA